MSNIYKGGVPETAGKTLHPSANMEGETSGVHGGEMKMGYKSGGPAENSGGGGKDGFVNDKSYTTAGTGLEVREKVEYSGKTVNPNDISTTV